MTCQSEDERRPALLLHCFTPPIKSALPSSFVVHIQSENDAFGMHFTSNYLLLTLGPIIMAQAFFVDLLHQKHHNTSNERKSTTPLPPSPKSRIRETEEITTEKKNTFNTCAIRQF